MGRDAVHGGDRRDHRDLVLLTHLRHDLRQGTLVAAHDRVDLLLCDQTLRHLPGHLGIPLGVAPDDLDRPPVHPARLVDILRRQIRPTEDIGADRRVIAAQGIDRPDPDRLAGECLPALADTGTADHNSRNWS